MGLNFSQNGNKSNLITHVFENAYQLIKQQDQISGKKAAEILINRQVLSLKINFSKLPELDFVDLVRLLKINFHCADSLIADKRISNQISRFVDLIELIKLNPIFTQLLFENKFLANLINTGKKLVELIEHAPEYAYRLLTELDLISRIENLHQVSRIVKANPSTIDLLVNDPAVADLIAHHPILLQLTLLAPDSAGNLLLEGYASQLPASLIKQFITQVEQKAKKQSAFAKLLGNIYFLGLPPHIEHCPKRAAYYFALHLGQRP